MINLEIGKKIKELRTVCNLTQEELANRTELTKGYISQLENDLAEPSISTLEDIVRNQWKKIEMLYNDIKQAERKINENDKRINELEVLVHVLMEKQNKNINI